MIFIEQYRQRVQMHSIMKRMRVFAFGDMRLHFLELFGTELSRSHFIRMTEDIEEMFNCKITHDKETHKFNLYEQEKQ